MPLTSLSLLPQLAIPLLLAAPPAANGNGAPDPIVELHAALGGLAGKAPVRARVTHRVERRQGEGKEATRSSGEVKGVVALGPEGLSITWSGAVLQQLLDEEKRRARDAESPSPTRDAIAGLGTADLAQRLDSAAELRLALEQSKLLEVRSEQLDGVQRRLLVLQLEPTLSARERRFVKSIEATARIWLGDDGLPLAAERKVKVSGRAFLVISFEQSEVERFRFAREGDRLVTVRHEQERQGEGAGERGGSSSVTTIEVLR